VSTQPLTGQFFTQVDHTQDPDFIVRFMDEAQKPAGIQASKRLMLERMALAPGQAVLEVGCGPGTDIFDLAENRRPRWPSCRARRERGHDR
jgi:cyclopropane fatty-acyl-phospholipid synthase-like methyltransferase